MKFLILFGVRKAQTPFYKSFTLSWLLLCLSSSVSSFKNLYLDLQVYLLSLVIAQTILSSNSLRPEGFFFYFFMAEVSYRVNLPSIMFVFQLLILAIIKESIVASSIDSSIGD